MRAKRDASPVLTRSWAALLMRGQVLDFGALKLLAWDRYAGDL